MHKMSIQTHQTDEGRHLMDGILRRLTTDDSEAENAIRVIAFFERLVAGRAGVDELVRSAAQLSGLTAGIAGNHDSISFACNAYGQPVDITIPSSALTRQIVVDGQSIGEAWLLEFSEVTSLTELVVERMALAAASILGRRELNPAAAASPLMEVLNPETPEDDRARAARGLSFHMDWSVRVLVVRAGSPVGEINAALQAWASRHGLDTTRAQVVDGSLVAVVHDMGGDRPLPRPDWSFQAAFGNRVKILDAARSHTSARQALRLTSATLGPRVIDFDELGPLQLLCELEPDAARSQRLVQQLMFLTQSETGKAELQALDAFCSHRSLRQASIALNLHHTSVSYRLKNLERKLNVDLADARTVFLFTFALQLFRIANW